MSTELVELVPILHDLKRSEKLFVIQYLVAELAKEETDMLKQDMEYQVWSPYEADDAAHLLLKYLHDVKAGGIG